MRGLDDEVKMCRRATLAVFDRFLSEKSKLSIWTLIIDGEHQEHDVCVYWIHMKNDSDVKNWENNELYGVEMEMKMWKPYTFTFHTYQRRFHSPN